MESQKSGWKLSASKKTSDTESLKFMNLLTKSLNEGWCRNSGEQYGDVAIDLELLVLDLSL